MSKLDFDIISRAKATALRRRGGVMPYTYDQLKDLEEQQIQRCVKILGAQAGLPPDTTSRGHRQLVEAIISATLLSMSALQAEAQQRHGAEGEK